MSRANLHSESATAVEVAVIGAGITGLAAAHRFTELLSDVRLTLFEATNRVGGVLETVRDGGFLIERSADSFVTHLPWARDLCQRVGLGDQLVPTNETLRRAFVVRKGQLQRLPAGFVLMGPQRLLPVLTSPILSPWGKLRLVCEPLVPRQRMTSPENLPEDISVAAFARRRLGNEVYERLVQPLLAGIYTADSQRLSMLATMPQYLRDVTEQGSLLRAARVRAASLDESAATPAESVQAESGARYGMFVAPRDGLSSLVAAVEARLKRAVIRLGRPVRHLARVAEGRWSLTFDAPENSATFDAVVLAVPAPQATQILQPVAPPLATALAAVEYASSVVVSLGYQRRQIRHALDGFGFVVPAIERRRILAASFASVKFPGRAAANDVAIRVFVGGALQPELTQLDDLELLDLAEEELTSLLGISGTPCFTDISRWTNSMPQYHVGHTARVQEIERLAAEWPGLELAGNAYHGVGIPQCIHSGELAAERIVGWLRSR